MIKVMFVCHGNICRSPMAEFIMKKLVSEAGLSDSFCITSSATSTEELGNPVYPPARSELAKHGRGCAGKSAVQLRKTDYEKYDYFIGMDTANIRNMNSIFGSDPNEKIYKLLTFAGRVTMSQTRGTAAILVQLTQILRKGARGSSVTYNAFEIFYQ